MWLMFVDCDQVCYGYKDHLGKRILFYTLAVLSFGILLLVMYWKAEWNLKLKKVRCRLDEADAVALKDSFNHTFVAYIIIDYIQDGKYAPHFYVQCC